MQLWDTRQEEWLHLFADEEVHEDDKALGLTLSDCNQHTCNKVHALTVADIRHAVGNSEKNTSHLLLAFACKYTLGCPCSRQIFINLVPDLGRET